MKAVLYIEGANAGASFLQQYNAQQVDIQSLFKDIEVNSPPLAILKVSEDTSFNFQVVDVRFIDEYIFINGYVTDKINKTGGKALVRLKPI